MPNAGSTDMANVSWVCPTIHPDLAIAPEGTPGHSILFRDAAATPRADETTLLAATLIAQTAVELFSDPRSSPRPGRSSARRSAAPLQAALMLDLSHGGPPRFVMPMDGISGPA